MNGNMNFTVVPLTNAVASGSREGLENYLMAELPPFQGLSIVSSWNVGRTISTAYERPFDDNVIWIFGIFIFTFLAVGLILNAITVAIIVKYKKLRNLFTYFIFSLCISDLLSALISPFAWYRRTIGFDHWSIPEFFCKFYWAADIMTSFATALHIVAFGIFRLISIRFPHFFRTISNKIGVVCAVIIWIICFTCGFVPYFIWFGVKERDRYSDSPDAKWPACTINMEWYKSYNRFQITGFTAFLFVPLVMIVIISILTCLQVHATAHSSTRSIRQIKKGKQAILQLTLIVISFLFGYLPFTALEFWSVQDHENTSYIRRFGHNFATTQYLCLRFSECMNPVFYNLGSTKMRKHSRKFLCHLFGRHDDSRRRKTASSLQKSVVDTGRESLAL